MGDACAIDVVKNKWTGIQSSVLFLAGDVAITPGPSRHSCKSCDNSVRQNEKRLVCCLCLDWFHAECVEMTDYDYYCLATYEMSEWKCDKCD